MLCWLKAWTTCLNYSGTAVNAHCFAHVAPWPWKDSMDKPGTYNSPLLSSVKYRAICIAWKYFIYCLSTYTYYTSHIVTGRAEKQGRSKQTQCLDKQIWGFTDHSSYAWCSLTGFAAARKLDIWIPQSLSGRALLESAHLAQLPFGWRWLPLEQRQPINWYRHSDNLRAQCTDTASTVSF